MRIRNCKAERMNEVQTRARNGAHPPDITRVLRNLRIKKNKVKHFKVYRLKLIPRGAPVDSRNERVLAIKDSNLLPSDAQYSF